MPYSTPEKPKQFLPITHPSQSMLQITHARIAQAVPHNNIWISTNQRYADLVQQQLPTVSANHIIGEPVKKNTAPAIALLNHLIHRSDPHATVCFLPADHYIRHRDHFLSDLERAFAYAAWNDRLLTFGITPDFPSTDYGYIVCGQGVNREGFYPVERFTEKPDEAYAGRLIKAGNCYWNGGMFVWQASGFMQSLEKHMPTLFNVLNELRTDAQGVVSNNWLQAYFEHAPAISVDYAILEKSDNVSVLPLSTEWSDVGTWQGLAQLSQRFKLNLPDVVKQRLDSYAD